MDIEILIVPYDSGHQDARLGRGPGRLLEGGLVDLLQRQGHQATVSWVHGTGGFSTEINSTFDLCRTLARHVRRIKLAGKLPLILSGNCFMALGAIAGLGSVDLGIVWFDSHGEFNTPETTTSGYLDGMGLATATGACWRMLSATIPEFLPVPPDRIVLVGGHDFDPQESSRLVRSPLAMVNASDIASRGLRDALAPALNQLRKGSGRIYVHIDMDVVDPSEACANELAMEGGTSVQEIEEAVTLLRCQFEVAGVGLAGYDPDFDRDGNTRNAAYRLLTPLLALPSTFDSMVPHGQE